MRVSRELQLRRRPLSIPPALLLLALSLSLPGRAPVGANEPQPVSFGAPVKMPMYAGASLLGGASEPSIALDSVGTIYVTAACCVPVPAPTWYSKDGGKTFQELTAPGRARDDLVGAEGDFAIDEADRVMFSDLNFPVGMVTTRWRDHGDTWERTVPASEKTLPLEDRPWLGWGKSALYMYVNSGLQTTFVYRSTDGGLTFNPLPVGSFSGNFPTMMAVNRRDGAIWLLGRNGFIHPELRSAVSTNDGASWQINDAATASRGAVSPTIGLSIATDEAGNGYAVWSTFDSNGCDIEMSASTDHGQTWSKPVKVNSTPGCSTFPWIDAGSEGRVAVVWYESDSLRNQAQVPTNATWHVHAAVTTDALSESPRFVESRLPNVVVDRGTLTTGYGQAGGSSRSLLDFFEVAIGPDGRFHVAYAENTSQPGVENVWYVGQAGGPRLHADRTAVTTVASVRSATSSGDLLSVQGESVFKRPAATRLFPRPPDPARGAIAGGTVARVGPDSDDLLLTLETLPNGTPGYDGVPGPGYWWRFKVAGTEHVLAVTSRDANGPRFTLDGKTIPGTIDGHSATAIARVPLSSVGASPGDAIDFELPGLSGIANSERATWTVPRAGVTLTLRQGGLDVTTKSAALSGDLSTFHAEMDLSGLAPGPYELVASACYAGDCAASVTSLTR